MNIGIRPARAFARRATETFRMVPDRLWTHPRLQLFDLKLWCALSFLARERGWCEVTDATLADETGASQQSVRRSLHRLEQEQFISRKMDGRARIIALNPEGNGEAVAAFTLKIAN